MRFKLSNTCYVSCACTLNFHSILMHPQVSLTKFSCSEWAPSIMIDPVYHKNQCFLYRYSDFFYLSLNNWTFLVSLYHNKMMEWRKQLNIHIMLNVRNEILNYPIPHAWSRLIVQSQTCVVDESVYVLHSKICIFQR